MRKNEWQQPPEERKKARKRERLEKKMALESQQALDNAEIARLQAMLNPNSSADTVPRPRPRTPDTPVNVAKESEPTVTHTATADTGSSVTINSDYLSTFRPILTYILTTWSCHRYQCPNISPTDHPQELCQRHVC